MKIFTLFPVCLVTIRAKRVLQKVLTAPAAFRINQGNYYINFSYFLKNFIY